MFISVDIEPQNFSVDQIVPAAYLQGLCQADARGVRLPLCQVVLEQCVGSGLKSHYMATQSISKTARLKTQTLFALSAARLTDEA